MTADRYETLFAEVIRTTSEAILVFIEGEDDPEVWIPRSVCENGHNIHDGDEEVNVMPWWLRKHGL